MNEASARGMIGERACANNLRDKGYTIVDANFRTRFGEIDFIAANKKYIVFVEVKTRGVEAWSSPASWVTPNKQRKVALAASSFLQYNGALYENLQPRFDVMEVIMNDNREIIRITHIENAFDAPRGIE